MYWKIEHEEISPMVWDNIFLFPGKLFLTGSRLKAQGSRLKAQGSRSVLENLILFYWNNTVVPLVLLCFLFFNTAAVVDVYENKDLI